MSRHLTSALLLCAGLAAGAAACLAQSRMERAAAAASTAATSAPTSPTPTAAPAAEAAEPAAGGSQAATEAVTAMPASPSETVLGDPETRRRFLTSMQRYYEYRANGYEYRSRVFEWQLLSSRFIFVVVLALVSAGLYFAAVQFRIAMRAAARKVDAAPTVGATVSPSTPADPSMSLATQLEVSAKGVVVNSSVMGVIILALSLAFFYLYLVHIYPIKDVF